jgi:hypothetical protein
MCAVHTPEVLIDPLAFPDFPESAKQFTRDRLLWQMVQPQDRSPLIKFANKLENGRALVFCRRPFFRLIGPTSFGNADVATQRY